MRVMPECIGIGVACLASETTSGRVPWGDGMEGRAGQKQIVRGSCLPSTYIPYVNIQERRGMDGDGIEEG